jgi:hypothetical protein
MGSKKLGNGKRSGRVLSGICGKGAGSEGADIIEEAGRWLR